MYGLEAGYEGMCSRGIPGRVVTGKSKQKCGDVQQLLNYIDAVSS